MTDCDDVEDWLAELESQLEQHSERFDAWRKHTVAPRFEQMETRSDDARDERAELRATIQDLQDQVANLQYELEALKGLGETESSTPESRVRDLRSTMIERAQTLDRGDGVQLWWAEVQEVLADLGHGRICKPDCYKAMDEAVEADGFDKTTKVNSNGNEVTAIRLKTAELPAVEVSSNPTTSQGVIGGPNGGETTPQHNQD